MSFRIDKGVPISEYYWVLYQKYYKRGNGRAPKYPFLKMEVGDSFLLPSNWSPDKLTRFRIIANAYNYKLGRRYVALKDDNHHWRCWRIE
jgi:hypothetical protein